MKTVAILSREEGFSLVEMIATLVILSIMGIGVAMYFVYNAQSFLMARATNEAYQKTSLAVERLAREIKKMDTVSQAATGTLRYSRDGTDFCVYLEGTNVRLSRSTAVPASGNGPILIDNISAFSLQFLDGSGNDWSLPSDNSLTGLSRVVITLTVDIYNSSRTFSIDINPLFNNTVNSTTT